MPALMDEKKSDCAGKNSVSDKFEKKFENMAFFLLKSKSVDILSKMFLNCNKDLVF